MSTKISLSTDSKVNPVKDIMNRAKPISDYDEKWHGISPFEIDNINVKERKDVEEFEMKQLLTQDIVVTGFKVFSGSENEFFLVSCVPVSTGKVSTFVTSSEVVCKKLRRIDSAKGFPISCKIVKPEGKRYFDLIA